MKIEKIEILKSELIDLENELEAKENKLGLEITECKRKIDEAEQMVVELIIKVGKTQRKLDDEIETTKGIGGI